MSFEVLFISRGYGFGHSIRDIAIIKQLRSIHRDLKITVASYHSGYEAFKMNGFEVIDLELPRLGQEADRLEKIGMLIKSIKPDLLLCDEEVYALPLAKIFDFPSVFITNWLPEGDAMINFFEKSDRIVFPDFPDAFPIAPSLKNKIDFVGPIIQFNGKLDRGAVRRELNVAPSQKLILVTVGKAETIDFPLIQASVTAFNMLKVHAKMVLVAGEYAKAFSDLSSSIITIGYLKDIHRYMDASDLVITRGGHTTLWELALLGIPAIAVPRPPSFNPVNEVYAQNMEKRGTAVFIPDKQVNVPRLYEKMDTILRNSKHWKTMAESGLKYNPMLGDVRAAESIMQLVA